MPLNVYNTLSRRKEPFTASGGEVKLFVCGPTVYDYAHLGHARTYLAFDMITRFLNFSGYKVRYLMNITDVAERIVERAQELKLDPLEFAHQYEAAFLEDMRSLGIYNVDQYERASEYIPQMIEQVAGLVDNGSAYETETGVYFEVGKFPKFGKLSRQNHEELGLKRLELCSSKHNPEDFSLWRKYDQSVLGWESPWGFGRPGWHIEDTAVSMNHFGETYDVHGGASELIFPHHESEIAQAEALTGKIPFVRFWLHTGLLNVEGRKMSKSLGNVIQIREALKRYTPQELRFYFASFHYRQPVVLSEAGLRRSKRELAAMNKALRAFKEAKPTGNLRDQKRLQHLLNQSEIGFRRKMNDDFDTPGALKVVKALAQNMRRLKLGKEAKRKGENAFRKMADVFGIWP